MSWVTPIFDRVLADITTPTAKGFFNVADWVRINGNSLEIKALLDANGYLDIPLTALTTPTTTDFPYVYYINRLIENIVKLQQSACLSTAMATLKYDYVWGANAEAPNYLTVNDWEENQNKLYYGIPKAIDYWAHCGTATVAVGQSRLWQNKFR